MLLADAFVALHAEGGELAPEIEAQATAGAVAAEATIAESVAAGGTAGGVAAGEAIAAGVTEGATIGGAAGGEILVSEMDAATLAAVSAMVDALAAGGAAGGAAAGQEAGAGIAAGIQKGAAAGAAAVQEELAASGAAVGGVFGKGFAKATPQIIGALVAVGAFAEVVKVSTEAAEEQEAVSIKLNNALLNNIDAASVSADQYKEQASALQDLTGVEDETIVSAQALLATFNLTGAQIQELTPLILDLSAKGFSLEAATRAVGKSVNGTTGGLQRMGVLVDKDAAKVDAYSATLEALSAVQGLAAEKGNTLAGQLSKLSANVNDIEETIGTVFLPGLTLMAQGLNLTADGAAEGGKGVSLLEVGLRTMIPATNLFTIANAKMTEGLERNTAFTETATTTLATWAQQLADGDLHAKGFQARLDALASSALEQGVAEENVNAIMDAGAGILDRYAKGVLGVADAHSAAAAEARNQYLQELSLAGGFGSIVAAGENLAQSQDDLATAQAKVNRLRAKGLTDTKRYAAAQHDLTGAELDVLLNGEALNEAILKQAQAMDAAGASGKAVREEVRLLGKEYGLTRGQVNDLIGQVGNLSGKYEDIPERVHTIFVAEGLAEATRMVDGFIGALNNIPGTVAPRFPKPTLPTTGGGGGGSGSGGSTSHQQGTDVEQRVALPPTTTVEVQLGGKLIYETAAPAGQRHRVLFSGRDDG